MTMADGQALQRHESHFIALRLAVIWPLTESAHRKAIDMSQSRGIAARFLPLRDIKLLNSVSFRT
jgi:hypothetical protein